MSDDVPDTEPNRGFSATIRTPDWGKYSAPDQLPGLTNEEQNLRQGDFATVERPHPDAAKYVCTIGTSPPATWERLLTAGAGQVAGLSTTLYVDPTGDDASAERGNIAKKYKTIGAAFLAAQQGDVIELAAFVWQEPIVWPATNRLTLKGQGQGATILKPTGLFSAVLIQPSAPGLRSATIQGCTIGNNSANTPTVQANGNAQADFMQDGFALRDVSITNDDGAGDGLRLTQLGLMILEHVYCFSPVRVREVSAGGARDSLLIELTVRWDPAQPLPAIPRSGINLHACDTGRIILTGQPIFQIDEATIVQEVTADLLTAGPDFPVIVLHGELTKGVDFGSGVTKYLVGGTVLDCDGAIIGGAVLIETSPVSAPGLPVSFRNVVFKPADPGAFTFGTAFPNSLINVDARGMSYDNQAVFVTVLGTLDRDNWFVPGVVVAPGIPAAVALVPAYPLGPGLYVVTATFVPAAGGSTTAAGDVLEDTGPHLPGGTTLTIFTVAPGAARAADVAFFRSV